MKLIRLGVITFITLLSSSVHAVGMVPETSLLLVNENEHGASMDVSNTDSDPALLYVKITDLPDDPLPALIVTQPVVRVEPGKVQRVRFVLKPSATPLKTEHLKRVVFTSIPEQEKNKVKVGFSQDLPVIIRPADLPYVAAPWKELVWSRRGNDLVVTNDTPYVIRLAQRVTLLPSGKGLVLPQPYILPKSHIDISLPAIRIGSDKRIEIYPATRYGYTADKFISEIK